MSETNRLSHGTAVLLKQRTSKLTERKAFIMYLMQFVGRHLDNANKQWADNFQSGKSLMA
jgi:hypothetical protein